ncbi:hypothetical protein QJS66_14985 [Kocuria rhizophila]|nr:hypothetical protein QJS66_14985 [Kocuria rhizophila]
MTSDLRLTGCRPRRQVPRWWLPAGVRGRGDRRSRHRETGFPAIRMKVPLTSKKNAFFATAAAAVVLGTVSPPWPPAQAPAPSKNTVNQQAKAGCLGGDYVVMLELRRRPAPPGARPPSPPRCGCGVRCVASTTEKQADKWQAKGVKVR